MHAKTIVSSPTEFNKFLFTSHEERITEELPKMEKNEELLAEEREELKYILPEAKLIKIYRG